MSTRACYTFTDNSGSYHVYKHHDGYPTGAAGHIQNALSKAWELPRYEADEFAAAFVAANKNTSGSVRLMPSGPIQDVAPGDIEYRYEIFPGNNGELRVTAYLVNNWGNYTEELLFNCAFSELDQAAEKAEAA